MDKTNIEWCDSTFNPWIGCTKVSPACDNCYAEAMMDHRMHKAEWGAGKERVRTGAANWKLPVRWNREACWFIQCNECGWRGESKGSLCGRCHSADCAPSRRRVFCASLADVFDNEVPWQWQLDLFDLISKTPNLDWLLLTKRIGNVKSVLHDIQVHGSFGDVFPNVWLGATICNQEEADRDIPKLLSVPARMHFVSIEPMLGSINLMCTDYLEVKLGRYPFKGLANEHRTKLLHMLDWVIVGGESGTQARPMHPQWGRDIRDQCVAAGVPFLFKQWGGWRPICQGGDDWYAHLYRSRRVARDGEDQNTLDDIYGRHCTVPTLCLRNDGAHALAAASNAWQQGTASVLGFRVGKRAAGRTLDGREWNEFPAVHS